MGKKKNSYYNQLPPEFEIVKIGCADNGNVKDVFLFHGLRMRKNGMPVANLKEIKTIKRLLKQGRIKKITVKKWES